MTDVVSLIKLVTPNIQMLVDAEFAKLSGDPKPGSALDQVNLAGGDKIVYDYLEHGEPRMAFDHLLYMVTETGIELTSDLQSVLAGIVGGLS